MTREEHRKRMEAVIADWRKSGIPVDEMAARAGVSEGTLWRWRKAVGPPAGGLGTALSPVRFLPVQIIGGSREMDGSSMPARRSLEVVLPSGTRLVVPEGFSAASLEELLPALVRTC